jgi:ketosteroid isomerase-like protein
MANVDVIREIFGAPGGDFRPIDGARYMEVLADDVRYVVTGTTRFSGTFVGRDDIMARLLGPLFAVLDGGIAMAVDSLFGDGDLVAMETRGRAATKDGGRYDNRYCFVFRFRDGRLAEIHEHLDTDLVRRVLG